MWLTGNDQKRVMSAERLRFRPPIPTQIISNGEFMPLPQTKQQFEVERRLRAAAQTHARRLGMDSASYLHTKLGMAAAFMAINDVHGDYFQTAPKEASDPEAIKQRTDRYSSQFVFDAQTHHVRPTYRWDSLLNLRRWTRGKNPWGSVWNPAVVDLPEISISTSLTRTSGTCSSRAIRRSLSSPASPLRRRGRTAEFRRDRSQPRGWSIAWPARAACTPRVSSGPVTRQPGGDGSPRDGASRRFLEGLCGRRSAR